MKSLAKRENLKGNKTNLLLEKMITVLAKYIPETQNNSVIWISISTASTHIKRLLFSSRRKCHTF